jgi:hypothetical protein
MLPSCLVVKILLACHLPACCCVCLQVDVAPSSKSSYVAPMVASLQQDVAQKFMLGSNQQLQHPAGMLQPQEPVTSPAGAVKQPAVVPEAAAARNLGGMACETSPTTSNSNSAIATHRAPSVEQAMPGAAESGTSMLVAAPAAETAADAAAGTTAMQPCASADGAATVAEPGAATVGADELKANA